MKKQTIFIIVSILWVTFLAGGAIWVMLSSTPEADSEFWNAYLLTGRQSTSDIDIKVNVSIPENQTVLNPNHINNINNMQIKGRYTENRIDDKKIQSLFDVSVYSPYGANYPQKLWLQTEQSGLIKTTGILQSDFFAYKINKMGTSFQIDLSDVYSGSNRNISGFLHLSDLFFMTTSKQLDVIRQNKDKFELTKKDNLNYTAVISSGNLKKLGKEMQKSVANDDFDTKNAEDFYASIDRLTIFDPQAIVIDLELNELLEPKSKTMKFKINTNMYDVLNAIGSKYVHSFPYDYPIKLEIVVKQENISYGDAALEYPVINERTSISWADSKKFFTDIITPFLPEVKQAPVQTTQRPAQSVTLTPEQIEQLKNLPPELILQLAPEVQEQLRAVQ